jgi:uncharacterized membrane protein YukC
MKTNLELFSKINIDGTTIGLTVSRQHMPLQPHQVTLLKQPCPMFLQCNKIFTDETAISFSFDTGEYYRPFSEIAPCTKLEKFFILLRIGKFFDDTQRRHSTSFNPRNILFTPTFEVAFLLRILPDIPQVNRGLHDEFEEYKALVLSVVQDQYSFSQLIQYGMDILDKDPFCSAILDTQTPKELEKLLTDEYTRTYLDTRKNRIRFRSKAVSSFTAFISLFIVGLFCTLIYFVYSNITETRVYGNKMYIYENYYNHNPQVVIDYANKLSETDMDSNLKRIVADALITTNDPENLKKAFSLDAARQVEIIGRLIDSGRHDLIATLFSDNHMAQLYIAYCAKDYQKAIALAENATDLKYNAQAQTLLAQVYMALNDYARAEDILDKLGDLDARIDAYKQHREAVLKNEENIALRQQLVDLLDEKISLLEELKRAKARQE